MIVICETRGNLLWLVNWLFWWYLDQQLSFCQPRIWADAAAVGMRQRIQIAHMIEALIRKL